jgi:thiamine-phosphate pyrophosphorylase
LGGGAGTVGEARALVSRPLWISVAAHTDDDVRRAADEGADAALVSPIFPTRSAGAHAAGAAEKAPRGVAALRSARAAARHSLLIYALGGITTETVGQCAAAGADGVALIRALLASSDPGRTARAIHDAFARR